MDAAISALLFMSSGCVLVVLVNKMNAGVRGRGVSRRYRCLRLLGVLILIGAVQWFPGTETENHSEELLRGGAPPAGAFHPDEPEVKFRVHFFGFKSLRSFRQLVALENVNWLELVISGNRKNMTVEDMDAKKRKYNDQLGRWRIRVADTLRGEPWGVVPFQSSIRKWQEAVAMQERLDLPISGDLSLRLNRYDTAMFSLRTHKEAQYLRRHGAILSKNGIPQPREPLENLSNSMADRIFQGERPSIYNPLLNRLEEISVDTLSRMAAAYPRADLKVGPHHNFTLTKETVDGLRVRLSLHRLYHRDRRQYGRRLKELSQPSNRAIYRPAALYGIYPVLMAVDPLAANEDRFFVPLERTEEYEKDRVTFKMAYTYIPGACFAGYNPQIKPCSPVWHNQGEELSLHGLWDDDSEMDHTAIAHEDLLKTPDVLGREYLGPAYAQLRERMQHVQRDVSLNFTPHIVHSYLKHGQYLQQFHDVRSFQQYVEKTLELHETVEGNNARLGVMMLTRRIMANRVITREGLIASVPPGRISCTPQLRVRPFPNNPDRDPKILVNVVFCFTRDYTMTACERNPEGGGVYVPSMESARLGLDEQGRRTT